MCRQLTYLACIAGLAAVVWGLPGLLFLFVVGMPVLQAALFGFLTGSFIVGALEMFGLLSKGMVIFAKWRRKE